MSSSLGAETAVLRLVPKDPERVPPPVGSWPCKKKVLPNAARVSSARDLPKSKIYYTH